MGMILSFAEVRQIRFPLEESFYRTLPLQFARAQMGRHIHPDYFARAKFSNKVGDNSFTREVSSEFVHWCVEAACALLDVNIPLFKRRPEFRALVVPLDEDKEPQPGDTFFIEIPNRAPHWGLIEKIEGDNVYTIEVNSDEDMGKKGYKVVSKVRPIKSLSDIGHNWLGIVVGESDLTSY